VPARLGLGTRAVALTSAAHDLSCGSLASSPACEPERERLRRGRSVRDGGALDNYVEQGGEGRVGQDLQRVVIGIGPVHAVGDHRRDTPRVTDVGSPVRHPRGRVPVEWRICVSAPNGSGRPVGFSCSGRHLVLRLLADGQEIVDVPGSCRLGEPLVGRGFATVAPTGFEPALPP
jgi:hypothetical protein